MNENFNLQLVKLAKQNKKNRKEYENKNLMSQNNCHLSKQHFVRTFFIFTMKFNINCKRKLNDGIQ